MKYLILVALLTTACAKGEPPKLPTPTESIESVAEPVTSVEPEVEAAEEAPDIDYGVCYLSNSETVLWKGWGKDFTESSGEVVRFTGKATPGYGPSEWRATVLMGSITCAWYQDNTEGK